MRVFARYLHGMFIVHRDLKPSNILVTKDMKTAKIADFGVSTTLHHQGNLLHGWLGSPIFMGPECWGVDGTGVFSGQAADMYGLGATLFAFVYGCVGSASRCPILQCARACTRLWLQGAMWML